MVESDVGDDAHDRDDEVGGVQPSAQSRFDDGDLDVALVDRYYNKIPLDSKDTASCLL